MTGTARLRESTSDKPKEGTNEPSPRRGRCRDARAAGQRDRRAHPRRRLIGERRPPHDPGGRRQAPGPRLPLPRQPPEAPPRQPDQLRPPRTHDQPRARRAGCGTNSELLWACGALERRRPGPALARRPHAELRLHAGLRRPPARERAVAQVALTQREHAARQDRRRHPERQRSGPRHDRPRYRDDRQRQRHDNCDPPRRLARRPRQRQRQRQRQQPTAAAPKARAGTNPRATAPATTTAPPPAATSWARSPSCPTPP